MESVNMNATVAPKSDQMNADDLIGGPRTIKITAVRHVSGDQPIAISYEGDDGKPWKPCKSMRRVLIHAWGSEGREYVGKSATLYLDPTVKYGGIAVGGIRISHLSDINRTMDIALTATRGRRTPYKVEPLKSAPPAARQQASKPDATTADTDAPATYPEGRFATELPRMLESIASGKATVEKIAAHCAKLAPLTADQLARLAPTAATESAAEEDDIF